MQTIQIGDYVTGYGSGYWVLIDIKPKIATEDYVGETVSWKKGEVIGKWAILKKCFTNKMKPRIDFSYEDFSWLKPVPKEISEEIEHYFEQNPKFKEKFERAEMRFAPMVTNCYLCLPEEKEMEFRAVLDNLPAVYTMDDFWKTAGAYKQYAVLPPAGYLLNLSTYPWHVDQKANLLYFDWELIKL